MRWRPILVLAASALALAAPFLLHAAPAQPAQSEVQVVRSQEGDAVTVSVRAFDPATGAQVYASQKPLVLTAASRDGALPGLGAALVNVTEGDTVNVTLAPADAFGNWSWENAVNVTRVEQVQRVQQLQRAALERYLGRYVQQGEVVELPGGPARVVQLDSFTATIRLEPALNASVQRSRFWPSTVIAEDNDTITYRADATVGTPVHVPSDDDENRAPLDGSVTSVTNETILVDFNAPLAGKTLRVQAHVEKLSAGASTLDMVAKATGLDCQVHHAGMVAFQAATDVAPNANGTAWVNVTVTNPWLHALQQGTVSVGNESKPVPDLPRGASTTISFLAPAGQRLNVTLDGTAHFAHGGGIPDDAGYASRGVVNTSAKQTGVRAAATIAEPFGLGTGWGRILGWLVVPLMLYPAYEGYRARQRRLQGLPPARAWNAWLDWHLLPAVAAMALGFAHGGVLMLGAYRGQANAGVWTGIVALMLLSALGVSGFVMARFAPVKWKSARRWHAWTTIVVLLLGALHAVIIGTTFKFLR